MLKAIKVAVAIAVLGLAGCGVGNLSDDPLQDLGSFRLGVNYAFSEKATSVGHTRRSEPGEWDAAIRNAMAARTLLDFAAR